jgi:hypothetical protein
MTTTRPLYQVRGRRLRDRRQNGIGSQHTVSIPNPTAING